MNNEFVTITIDASDIDIDTDYFTISNNDIDTFSIPDGLNSTFVWNEYTKYYSVDKELLDKYPTLKSKFEEFEVLYKMCEEEEKLNGNLYDNDFKF